MIDLHSHILPEVDDGAGSIGEALSMANIAVKEGIDAVVATPHCLKANDIDGFVQGVERQRQQLQLALDAKGMDLDVFYGTELLMDPIFLRAGGLDRLTINGTHYILVELPMGDVPFFADDFVYKLQLAGLIPVIAHPERNLRIINDPNKLYRFVDRGCLCQINTGSITGLYGKQVQKCARILLTHGMGHVLGTDTHSDGLRGPYMKEAVETLKKWLDPIQVNKIIGITPYDIVQGNPVDVEPPRRYKRSIWRLWFFK
jgi:protein-tyrosine phosphatase